MLPHYQITITNPTRTLLVPMNTSTATPTQMTIPFTTIFQISWTLTTSPPPTCSTPLTISSTIFCTHCHPHLYMNDYIYSSYFPNSIFAGTVLRPGYPLDPYYSICRRLAIISAASNFPSSRLAGIPFSYSNGRLPAPGDHSRLAGPSPSWVPAGPLLQHLSTLSYRPVDLPERRLRRDTIFIIFCYHIGITFRSRSLVVFFQLRSVSCAPFTPTFADGVVQRSLALYLPCFVSLCSPVWPRAISHRSSSFPHPRTNHPLSAIAIVAHDFPSWFFSRSMTPFV